MHATEMATDATDEKDGTRLPLAPAPLTPTPLRPAPAQPAHAGATPDLELTWRSAAPWLVAAAIALLLAFLTYTREGWVPLLSYFDLGVHEFGHLLTMWAPEMIVWPAGSVMQVALPLACAAYFLHRGDRFAVVLTVAWAAESLNNVSVYAADAQAMVLPLFGDDGSGAGHDWHNILGRLGWLESTETVARVLQLGSVMLFVAALSLAVWWLLRPQPAE
jgi:hypothetical protein